VEETWQDEFGGRMSRFRGSHPPQGEVAAVSIKLRVTSGCFHRSCSPRAYAVVDQYLDRAKRSEEFTFEEHESGPELLAYVALTTAGISLAKSVIDLIVTLVKARKKGVAAGDRPSAPLELIVRRSDEKLGYREEMVVRIGCDDPVTERQIEAKIRRALGKILRNDASGPE
jgi:hypothetical protein